MTDERATISSARLSASDVVRHSFGVVRRGFDPGEVRSFLELIAKELQSVEAREHDLRRQIAEAEERAKNPVLDEATLTAALGQSSAQVLRNAHEEAARITERAEQAAAEQLRRAQLQAAELDVASESTIGARIAEAELLASALEQSSQRDAEQLLQSARNDGETLVAHAREQGRAMVEQAQEARRRVLEDMDRRRRRMHVQIEQLRAARDELAAAIVGVRNAVDRITDELSHSDEDARLAAMEVARRQPTLEGLTDDELAIIADDEIDDPSPLVDELFAKIRASVSSEEAAERELLESAPKEPEAVQDAQPKAVTELPTEEVPVVKVEDTSGLIAARDAAVAESVASLTKRVKRALQDDQNAMLERLRSGKAGVDGIIGAEADERALYVDQTLEVLVSTAKAGAQFTAHPGSTTVSPDPALMQRLAEHMAATIVTLLRRHLAEAGSELTPEALSAAFKEWRGARVDGLVADVALSAFASGQVALTTNTVRWVVASSGQGCAECVANSAATPRKAGTEFPSGHRHPPVHAGCRCALVTANA